MGSPVSPYMPNSAPKAKAEMLAALQVSSPEELYRDLIPQELLYQKELQLPPPIPNEYELSRHVQGILNKNISCEEYSSFLGAGCYRHFVPAVCSEIAGRSEFLTAYCGDTYSDHGKMQAIFEYQSMMGELLDLDVVSYTCYDAGQAVSSSLRMALRLGKEAGRTELLVPDTMNPEILSQLRSYCQGFGTVRPVAHDPKTGRMDLAALRALLSDKTAAVFLENPSYLGFFEEAAEEIGRLTHEAGAVFVVSPEIASLGVVESPANYGADIVCGDIQPLGIGMHYGGGCAGFLAVRDDPRYIDELPTYLYGIAKTQREGEFGWGRALNERCSHGSREKAREYFGTASGLWAIVAGSYLGLMGPAGMQELGERILQRTEYAVQKLSAVPGLKVDPFGGARFQEFIINFDAWGLTVQAVNQALLGHHIFGGKDLSADFPALGQSALVCISEITSVQEIDALAEALCQIGKEAGK
jgi:glycine dehydrogenase subunit 1